MADQTNIQNKPQTYNRTENKSCQDDGRVAFETFQTYNRTENKSRQDDGRSNKQGGIQNKPQTYNRTENKSR